MLLEVQNFTAELGFCSLARVPLSPVRARDRCPYRPRALRSWAESSVWRESVLVGPARITGRTARPSRRTSDRPAEVDCTPTPLKQTVRYLRAPSARGTVSGLVGCGARAGVRAEFWDVAGGAAAGLAGREGADGRGGPRPRTVPKRGRAHARTAGAGLSPTPSDSEISREKPQRIPPGFTWPPRVCRIRVTQYSDEFFMTRVHVFTGVYQAPHWKSEVFLFWWNDGVRTHLLPVRPGLISGPAAPHPLKLAGRWTLSLK